MVKCYSYLFGSSEKGTEWLMLKSSLQYDRKSGDTKWQMAFLFTITNDKEREVAKQMAEDIDAGKSVNGDEKHQLRQRA